MLTMDDKEWAAFQMQMIMADHAAGRPLQTGNPLADALAAEFAAKYGGG